jgi:hypothetical protein
MIAKVFGFGLCTAAILKNGSEKLRDGDGPPVGTIDSSTYGSGKGGLVIVRAEQIRISHGAEIASTAAGSGAGGVVKVTARRALLLDGTGTQIAASATSTASFAPAGLVGVSAGRITLRDAGEILSTTAGSGLGGLVKVTARRALLLDGAGTQIAASATSTASFAPAGLVEVPSRHFRYSPNCFPIRSGPHL